MGKVTWKGWSTSSDQIAQPVSLTFVKDSKKRSKFTENPKEKIADKNGEVSSKSIKTRLDKPASTIDR